VTASHDLEEEPDNNENFMYELLLKDLMEKHSAKELYQRVLLGKMIIFMIGKDEEHPKVKDNYFALLDEFLITDEERKVFGFAPRSTT
jgi:hypothetical protein